MLRFNESAVSTISSAWGMVAVIGFSIKICLPASRHIFARS